MFVELAKTFHSLSPNPRTPFDQTSKIKAEKNNFYCPKRTAASNKLTQKLRERKTETEKLSKLFAFSYISFHTSNFVEREKKFEKASEKGQKISSSALFSSYYRLLQLEIQIRFSKLPLKLQSYQSVSLRSDSPSQFLFDSVLYRMT